MNPPPAAARKPQPVRELDQLKDLLVGRECRDLAALQERVGDPAQRARDVAAVLPEALRAGSRAGDRLASALQEPVGRCIRISIQRDTKAYADALFPVMGPAIRRSIAETLKSFVQTINQAVEHSLSPRGLLWRWEAMRSGVSFAEVVLKHTLVYRVEAAYLIHNRTGLLIEHVTAASHTTLKDEDAVSAMLTAIRDFVEDSFAGVEPGGLEAVEIGSRTLWLVKGAEASLACLISGIPPAQLRGRLAAKLAEIHAVFAAELADFQGDDRPGLEGVQPLLEEALELEYREATAGRCKTAYWPWLVALLLVLAGLGYLWWQGRTHQERLAGVEQRLRDEPGILVVEWRERGGRVRADLLRDPLAPEPGSLVADLTLGAAIDFTVTPFQSLEPTIVVARARRLLRPPPGVELRLAGETLHAAGSAPPEWTERARASLVLPPGVSELDLRGVSDDLSGLPAAVRAALDPPEGVTLSLQGKSLVIGGTAPWAWIESVTPRLRSAGLVESCAFEDLRVREWEEAQGLAADVRSVSVLFADGVDLAVKADEALAGAARRLQRLGALDQRLRLGLKARLVGHSDGVGARGWNLWLRQRRADFVRDALVEKGVAAALLSVEVDESFRPSPVPVPGLRRVVFEVLLTPPALPACLP